MGKGISELSAVATLSLAVLIAISTLLVSFFIKTKKPTKNISLSIITTSVPVTTSIEPETSEPTSTVESTISSTRINVSSTTSSITITTTLYPCPGYLDCCSYPSGGPCSYRVTCFNDGCNCDGDILCPKCETPGGCPI